MYVPRQFAARDPAHALELVRAHPFATLITTVDGAVPQLTHLPLLLEEGLLWGHVAKANPHWQAFAEGRTLALFHGPHQYISPRSYQQPENHVPTWNYAAVHVHGQPELLDVAGARRVVERLTDHYERGQWAAVPEKLERLLPGIVAFRMPLTRVEAKFKMSQNRAPEDRSGVIPALTASGQAEDAAVAGWVRRCND
jgi:transcriptional regulator